MPTVDTLKALRLVQSTHKHWVPPEFIPQLHSLPLSCMFLWKQKPKEEPLPFLFHGGWYVPVSIETAVALAKIKKGF